MEEGISENSSEVEISWALMLKHSFQAFLLNFLRTTGITEILGGSEFGLIF